MPKGESGRVVVELEPSLKRRLYSALAMDSKTLKEWMIENIECYLSDQVKTKESDGDNRA
jgi:hypothetical protein